MISFLKRHEAAVLALALIILTSAAYWRVLGNGFIVYYDDGGYVTQNAHVNAGLTGAAIKWAITGMACGNWHPLTWMSHMLDCTLFGLKPMGHHAVNLLFHLMNTVLLMLVLRRMTGSTWRSGFVAALFAIHPLHVESVAWIAERKDVLSTFFWFLTIGAYVLYAEKASVKRYLPVVILYALGLMAKPMLVTLPLTLLLLDYWPLSRARRGWSLIVEKLPLFAMAAGSCVMTLIAQNKGEAISALNALPLNERIGNAVVSYIAYIGKMLWPVKLAIFYPHPKDTLSAQWVAGSVVLLVGISALVLNAGRKRPYLGFGWLWYLITLVPVIGVLQVGLQSMADRYTYVPLIGLFVAITWGIADLAGRTKGARLVLPVVACLIAAVLAIGTWVQVGYWRDSSTVFQHAIDVTEGNFVAQLDLGLLLSKQGKYDEAIEHYNEAIAIRPDWDEAYFNLGAVLAKKGDISDAIDAFKEALFLNANYAAAKANLIAMLMKAGRVDEALQLGQGDTGTSAGAADLHYNMGCALEKQGKYDEAMKEYREAVRLEPGMGQAHNSLAVGYFFQKQYADAWKEAHLAQKNGFRPRPDFLKALSQQMPDPGE